MTEIKKKWIDKEWSKLIVGGIISLIVGFILIIITIIITPLPVGNILNGYSISLQRLINRIIFYKFAVWELILAAFFYYCFTLAKRQNKINKEVPVKEVIKVLTELDEPSVLPARPKVQLATQRTRPVSKGDYTPADKSKTADITGMLDYVADKWDGITYRWKWIKNPYINEYEVKNFEPVCTNEGCLYRTLYDMKKFGLGWFYRCPNCETEYHTLESTKELISKIESKYPHKVTKH